MIYSISTLLNLNIEVIYSLGLYFQSKSCIRLGRVVVVRHLNISLHFTLEVRNGFVVRPLFNYCLHGSTVTLGISLLCYRNFVELIPSLMLWEVSL